MKLTAIKNIFMALVILFSSLFCGAGRGSVVGYDGYERCRLRSDNSPALCESVITGDFIQPWYCCDWTSQRWDEQMEMLSLAGIEMLIVQNTASSYQGDDAAYEGKYGYFYYPSEIASDAEYSSPDCRVYPDMLENCLKAAQKYGMKIWIGLGANTGWWSQGFLDKAWREKETAFICRQADEIYGLYNEKYSGTIAGWYWFHEMYVASAKPSEIPGKIINGENPSEALTYRYEKQWSEMLNSCLAHFTQLDASMPLLMSPFISSYEDSGLLRTAQCWAYLMEHTQFREGDIFCPQDGFGSVGVKTLAEIEQIAYAIQYACSLNDNVRLWFNVECFTSDGESAPIGRFVNQINICSKFAERLISFSFSHYYSNLNGTGEAYNDYMEYLNSLNG